MAEGKGHPLPASDEARHDQIPESLEAEKGRGDDSSGAVRAGRDAVAPDGESYPVDDLAQDQAAHQDRGQSDAADAEREAD